MSKKSVGAVGRAGKVGGAGSRFYNRRIFCKMRLTVTWERFTSDENFS